ncbi:hypothetical protein ACOSQ2_028490 [Xanthoceras sorbifolium]
MFGLNLGTSYPSLSLSKNRLTFHWPFLGLDFCIFWIEDHKVKYQSNLCVFGCEWNKKEAERFGEGKITRIRKKQVYKHREGERKVVLKMGTFKRKEKIRGGEDRAEEEILLGGSRKKVCFGERERLILLLLR